LRKLQVNYKIDEKNYFRWSFKKKYNFEKLIIIFFNPKTICLWNTILNHLTKESREVIASLTCKRSSYNKINNLI